MRPKVAEVGIRVKKLTSLLNQHIREARPRLKMMKVATPMQGWIIAILIDSKGKRDVFQKDIEAELDIVRSSATALLQRMEKKGLITREPLPDDSRWKKILLTKKAIGLHEEICYEAKKMEERFLRGISDKELAVFSKVLDKMNKNLK